MTTVDVMRALRRWWWVVMVGAVVTLALAWSVHATPGVWSTSTRVVFVTPVTGSGAEQRELISSQDDLVAAAGLVERIVDASARPEAVASGDVPLSGRGIRSGVLVTLPNRGGQWENDFSSPYLVVEAVASDPRTAEELLQDTVTRIGATLRELQRADTVAEGRMITTSRAPVRPVVVHETGRPSRAAAAVLLLGSSMTLALVVGLDLLVAARRGRLRPSRRSATSPDRRVVRPSSSTSGTGA